MVSNEKEAILQDIMSIVQRYNSLETPKEQKLNIISKRWSLKHKTWCMRIEEHELNPLSMEISTDIQEIYLFPNIATFEKGAFLKSLEPFGLVKRKY